MSKPKTAGLANVSAGTSAICTVGKEGKGLNYRGYSIEDLATNAGFEEVAYLLIYGRLPNAVKLNHYQNNLINLRTFPNELNGILELLPKSTHPMDVLRTGVSALGCLEPEENFEQQYDIADRLLSLLPGMLLYWYHFHFNSKRINTESMETTLAGHFLRLLKGQNPDELEKKVLDVSLTLYAEHEFNASTFAARVAASTLSDFYSTITSAIGTLRGPLHGGANEAAMELIKSFSSIDDVEIDLQKKLDNKEKIMGFGHRVYSESDPRNDIIKQWSEKLSKTSSEQQLFPISQAIEKFMWNKKKLFPNLDFYSASAYNFMNIPVALYTPIFVCSRITGWAAHVFEQRENNALIRPSSDYNGPEPRKLIPLDQRK